MGAFAVVGRGWVVGLAAQTERSAYEGYFPLNSAYRLSAVKA